MADLFDYAEPRPLARNSDPETSHQAAGSMAEAARIQRQQILDLLRARGPLTADEVDAAIGWRPTTAGRRLHELVKLGLVERTEDVRQTRSGRAAAVYRPVDG